MSPKDRLNLALNLIAEGVHPEIVTQHADRLIAWANAQERKAPAATVVSEPAPSAELRYAEYMRALRAQSDG